MVPVRFLVICPFCVIEVCLSARLEVVLFASAIFKSLRVEINALIDAILNIICLSLNWVTQYFISFYNQFEMVLTQLFLFFSKCTLLEVGVM